MYLSMNFKVEFLLDFVGGVATVVAPHCMITTTIIILFQSKVSHTSLCHFYMSILFESISKSLDDKFNVKSAR